MKIFSKTDIKFTLPRFHIIRPKHIISVAEGVVKNYLHFAFWISPLALLKLWELIKPLIDNLK